MRDEQYLKLYPRMVRSAVETILPRAIRQEAMEFLEDRCESTIDWVRESIGTIVSGYSDQFIIGVNQFGLALEVLAAVYCFSVAGLELPLLAILGGLVLASILRTAYTNPFSRLGATEVSPWQYSIDSAIDAVVAMLLVFFCEAVMMKTSLSPTLPKTMFGRGVFIFFPLLATLRMVFRPRVQPAGNFDGSKLTAEQIYKRVWWMNILWIFALQSTIAANPYWLPEWLPGHDFLRTFVPAKMFIIWFRIQQNPLIRRDIYETLRGNWQKKKKARQRERLIKGLRKGEPFYGWYVGLQGALFIYLAIPLGIALRPWLAGGETNVDLFAVFFQIALLITLVWTWNALKEANRMAAHAMQLDIDGAATAVAVA